MDHHTANEHEWSDFSYYHHCAHGPLTQKGKWIPKGAPTHGALKAIVLDPRTINDFKFLTHLHSGELDVYHSLYNVYCPKRLSFSYEVMYVRTQLAGMDHNSDVGRQQAKINKGELRYKTPLSKLSNTWGVKNIMAKKNKTFINDILQTTWDVT